MNYTFQPGKRKGRNRYVGSWTETGWRDIPLPFTRESLVTVLAWGAGEQSSTHSHQDIAHWCDRFHMLPTGSGSPPKIFSLLIPIFFMMLAGVSTYLLSAGIGKPQDE
jgi:hypothetical protein